MYDSLDLPAYDQNPTEGELIFLLHMEGLQLKGQ